MNNKTSNIYPWVVVGLLWGVALLNYMDRQMLSTMRIPMMEDVRELESAANFGRLMAVFPQPTNESYLYENRQSMTKQQVNTTLH